MPSLDKLRFQKGGDNSFRAGARRRLGETGVAIFGSHVKVKVSGSSQVDCEKARRAVRFALAHAGDAWIPGRGGGLLGRPSGWGCRFIGVKTDPSQHVGRHVWDDPDSDVLCISESGSRSFTAQVVGISSADGGGGGRMRGGVLEALLGSPGANYIECRSPTTDRTYLCEPQLAGIGRGLFRALARLGGYGSKTLSGAKARLGRVGLSGLSARQLLGLEQFARTRALELQNLLPAATARRVTMAVGVGRDSKGFFRVVVASSEKGSALRPAVKEAVEEAGETIAKSSGREHAEVQILRYMQRSGLRPITVGAGRRICREKCTEAIRRAGATAATEIRPPP